MDILDPGLAGEILKSISPVAIQFAIVFSLADMVFSWFMRVAFGKYRELKF